MVKLNIDTGVEEFEINGGEAAGAAFCVSTRPTRTCITAFLRRGTA